MTNSSEPQAVNTLTEEAESLRTAVKNCFQSETPDAVERWFGDSSRVFEDEVLARWRLHERFDELIEYIIYQHEEHGGEELWQQVLLDLRLKKDDQRAIRLICGLIPSRLERIKIHAKRLKTYPDNYLIEANLGIAKGEALKLLYEHAFILQNKPSHEIDTGETGRIRQQIRDVISA